MKKDETSIEPISSDFFRFTKTSLEISEDTPINEWRKAGLFLKQAEGSIQFWIGDWINFGERKYGNIKEIAEKNTEYGYGSLRNMASVSSKLSLRNDNLSYNHHCAVAPLVPEKQKEWLEKAEKENLSTSELRKAIQIEQRNQKTINESISGKFPVVYADPPWSYSNSGLNMSAAKQYPTMETDKICSMEIPTTDDSVLFLWATNPLLEDALRVMSAWGFEYKTNFVWKKDRHTFGFYCYGQHELLLIGTKGSMLPNGDGMVSSVIEEKRSEHSRKPESVYGLIEGMYGGPYLELFARRTRDGWSSFGNEL